MKSKNKKSSPLYYLLLFISLIFIVIVYFVFNQKRTSNTVRDQVTIQTNPVQKIKIEGLLNEEEIPIDKLDLQRLNNPVFSIVNQEANIEGYDTQDNFSFNELDKKSFYCFPKGEIRDETVTFYFGSSRYRNENTKLIFNSDYLLENVQLPKNEKTRDENLIYCWNETTSEITLNKPDFGLIYWTEQNNEKYHNQVILFSGDKQLQISAKGFRNVVPLYLTSEKFLAVFQASGGGWNDTEVISFNLRNMTFRNEDNCASLFPRDSVSFRFDQKCYWGIEGNPQDSVGDFGFERK